MDGQVFLGELIKEPDVGAFINCLNNNLPTIISGAEEFFRKEGEKEFLVPWSLSRLLGQTCTKETRLSHKTSIQYTEATTEWKLRVDEQDEEKAGKKQEAVDRAFIRGVLDGKVFFFHGHRYPKLPEYLSCLSQPDSLGKILIGMRMATFLGGNLDKPRSHHVAYGESFVCKEF